MTRSTWLEVSVNGPWSRDRQPLIPITVGEIVAEGIACARAGAAIVHVHAYDERTGRQKDDADLYAAIIEGIRAKEDVIVYPTIPFAGSIDSPSALSANARFRHIETLAKRGLLEWAAVDPGSTQISTLAEVPAGKEGFIYANPEAHVRWGRSWRTDSLFIPGTRSTSRVSCGWARRSRALMQRYRNPSTASCSRTG